MKMMYRFFRFYDFTSRVLVKWYRFHDSSDSTVLSQEFYESEVPILRFSAVDERTRYIRGFYVQLSCYHFLIHDNLKVKS